MIDDWEDWDCDDFSVPVLNIQTSEQKKILEERKLVEEADNKLARQLFNDDEDEEDKSVYTDLKKIQRSAVNITKKEKPIKKISNQKTNELKQKEISKIIREQKAKKQKENELYGSSEYYNEYSELEDKYF
jgi:hypothetical protein